MRIVPTVMRFLHALLASPPLTVCSVLRGGRPTRFIEPHDGSYGSATIGEVLLSIIIEPAAERSLGSTYWSRPRSEDLGDLIELHFLTHSLTDLGRYIPEYGGLSSEARSCPVSAFFDVPSSLVVSVALALH